MDKREYYKDPVVAGGYEAARFESPAGRLAHQAEVDALKRLFLPQERLLELACGTGRLLRSLRQEGWSVAGVDQSLPMLTAGFPSGLVDVRVGDVFDLPFPDGSFDGAYNFRFTNHYPDLRPLFSECRRVLRAGGHLVFDSMRWSPLLWDFKAWGGRNHPVCDRQVRAWLAESGFVVEEVRPLFPLSPYLLGSLPCSAARLILASGSLIPQRMQAVALWHARKTR